MQGSTGSAAQTVRVFPARIIARWFPVSAVCCPVTQQIIKTFVRTIVFTVDVT